MAVRVLILLVAVVSLISVPSFAQTTQSDVPRAAQANPADNMGNGMREGDDAFPSDDGAYEEHAHAPPPPDPPDEEVDVTVGVGGSVDRAPRDIREPFDE